MLSNLLTISGTWSGSSATNKTVLSPATEPIVCGILSESIASPAAGPHPERVFTNTILPEAATFKIVSLNILTNLSLIGPSLLVDTAYLYLPEVDNVFTSCSSLISLDTVACVTL